MTDDFKNITCDELETKLETLQSLVYDRKIPEDNLIKGLGNKLGAHPRTRLNYLIALETIPAPTPVFWGQGKGGARYFHRDVYEIVGHMETLMANSPKKLPISECAKMVKEERESRIIAFLDEIPIDKNDPQTYNVKFLNKTVKTIREHHFFSKKTIQDVYICSLGMSLLGQIRAMENDIGSVNFFVSKIFGKLTPEDQKIVNSEIDEMCANRDDLKKLLLCLLYYTKTFE